MAALIIVRLEIGVDRLPNFRHGFISLEVNFLIFDTFPTSSCIHIRDNNYNSSSLFAKRFFQSLKFWLKFLSDLPIRGRTREALF